MSRRMIAMVGSVCMLSLGMLVMTGCENREKILEIDTPGGNLQIDRVEESEGLDLDINRDDGDGPGGGVEIDLDRNND